VRWTNQTTDNHRNKVWIFVDFQSVISPTQKGNWQPATITGTVQKTAGTVSEQSNRGFFLEGTTTNFSSTLTVQLSNTITPFNWCVYGSDYPPNVAYNNITYNGGTYTFKGTPPFKLVSADGLQSKEFNKTSITVAEIGFVPKNFTDATGCPGIGFCPYTGNDELIDVNHFCQLRTSGAKNWEAYIQDARDNKIYRIVQLPDQKWYMAQDLDYRGGTDYAYNASYCTTYIYGVTAANSGTVCPSGWDVPTSAVWTQLLNTIDGGANNWAAFWSQSDGGTDIYGYTAAQHCELESGGNWYKTTNSGAFAYRAYWSKANKCEQIMFSRIRANCTIGCWTSLTPAYTPIRCYRQL
jgi:uncharacterized protein (TIGR02145 family)